MIQKKLSLELEDLKRRISFESQTLKEVSNNFDNNSLRKPACLLNNKNCKFKTTSKGYEYIDENEIQKKLI
jgi:hypothetical protein